jgi:hypothetical protein
MSKKSQPPPQPAQRPEPIDVVDGIPDRGARRPTWKYLLLVAIMLGWMAFLLYCWMAP